jgi:hypothetical protein
MAVLRSDCTVHGTEPPGATRDGARYGTAFCVRKDLLTSSVRAATSTIDKSADIGAAVTVPWDEVRQFLEGARDTCPLD